MSYFYLDVVGPNDSNGQSRIIPVRMAPGYNALFISGPVVQYDGKSGFLNIGRVVPRDGASVALDECHSNPEVLRDAIEYSRGLIRHGADVFAVIAVSDSGQRIEWRGNVDLYGGPVDSNEFPAPKSQNNPGWAEF